MNDDLSTHRPEHGDDDLDIGAVITVVLSGAFIFLVVVLALRAYVHGHMAAQHEEKVVTPEHHALVDHQIEQRVLLSDYALNADGKTGRIPITEAMELVVAEHAQPDQGPDQPAP